MSVSVYEKRKGRETNERGKEEKYGEKNEKERQVERYSWIKQGGGFFFFMESSNDEGRL